MAPQVMPRKPRELTAPGLRNATIRLRSRQSGAMAYSFRSGDSEQGPSRLLVFISGLDNPRWIWQRALNSLLRDAAKTNTKLPPILLYDRFGVGDSEHDPNDVGKEPNEYHDGKTTAEDLRELISQVLELEFAMSREHAEKVPLVFCGHSFGVCTGRLFSQIYPGLLEGFMMLDSAIADIAAEKLIPNPDKAEEWERFEATMRAQGETADDCRQAIIKIQKSVISGYTMTTKERVRWDNMPELLPLRDSPKLSGPTTSLPLVTVIVCDPDKAIPQHAKALGISATLMRHGFFAGIWPHFQALPSLQPEGRGKFISAPGTGHMVHVDAPDLVAKQLLELLQSISGVSRSKM